MKTVQQFTSLHIYMVEINIFVDAILHVMFNDFDKINTFSNQKRSITEQALVVFRSRQTVDCRREIRSNS